MKRYNHRRLWREQKDLENSGTLVVSGVAFVFLQSESEKGEGYDIRGLFKA